MQVSLERRIVRLLPERVRVPLIRLHRRLVSTPVGARLLRYHGKGRELQEYWRNPPDDWNLPGRYASANISSLFLVELVRKHATPESRILEIGCNAGRNLDYLFRAGFIRLGGIEINEEAVRLLRRNFPNVAANAEIHQGSVEATIRTIEDEAFGVVFTMAVLEHVHSDSEWVFREMVRVTSDYLITIEDEKSYGWGHFTRDYRKVFESLGMTEIASISCRGIEGLGERFFARVFVKRVGPDHELP